MNYRSNFYLLALAIFISACQPKSAPMPTQKSIAFIGTYTQKEGHVDGKGAGVSAYETGPNPADWKLINTFSDIINPSYICLSPTLPIVYAVSEQGPNVPEPKSVIKVIEYDPVTFEMKEKQQISAQGHAPCYISTDRAGKNLFVANYVSGNVVQYAIQKDGRLAKGISAQHEGKGPDARQEGPHAHFIQQHPSQPEVYAVDLGTDEVIRYNPTENGLLRTGVIKTNLGSGPRHLTWHPNGKIFYLLNELSGTVESWQWSGTDVVKVAVTNLNTQPDSLFAGSADIHISNDGQFVYATLRGDFDEIITLKVDPTSYGLTEIQRISVGGNHPRNFAISPDQSYIAVGLQNSNQVTLFNRAKKDGTLSNPQAVKIKTPVCIAWQ